MWSLRLWCVAHTMRTSTGISCRPPIRSMTRSCRKRSSFACSDIGRSPISSRNSVPPLRHLDLADRLLRGPGVCPFFVAEQFAFEKRFRYCGAVDGDEALALARRQIVQRAREEFLARAGFAQDQHARRRRRDLFDRAADPLHFRVARDDPGHRRRLMGSLQPPVFFLQFVHAERPVDRPRQDFRLERLGAEVMRAERDRLQRIRRSFCPVRTITLVSGASE